jgi:hypothetical protein
VAPLTPWECKRRIDLFMAAAGETYLGHRAIGMGYLGAATHWHHRFFEALRDQEAAEGLIAWRRQSDETRAWHLEHPTFDPEKSAERGTEARRRLGLDD